MKHCPTCARTYTDQAKVCAFDGIPLNSGSSGSWPAAHASALPEIDGTLGAYRILEQLAEGGMGVVYRAEHRRLGRTVAIKVLKPELVDQRADVITRFLQEARAVNEIGHPNLIDIHDFVEINDVHPPLMYMVMELLEGEDLSQHLLARGPMEPVEVLRIAAEIVDALVAVHRVKILHRDLKPENIFLCRTSGETTVKLLDFGIAKSLDRPDDENLTEPGVAIGTPEYMAPEQVMGRKLDARTDIYSLGMVLYHMLAGASPFRSRNLCELMIMQVQQEPEHVSARRSGPPAPGALNELVMRCIRKDPGQRFQDMVELRGALQEISSPAAADERDVPTDVHTPVAAPIHPAGRSETWRLPLLALGVVAVTLGSLTVWSLSSREAPAQTPANIERPAPQKQAPRIVAAPREREAARRPSVATSPKADAGPVRAATPPSPVARRRPAKKKVRRVRRPVKKAADGRRAGSNLDIERTVDPFAR